MTQNGVAAILSKCNLQSEYVTNARPYSSTVQQFHYIKFRGFCQDNLILQITERAEFALMNEQIRHSHGNTDGCIHFAQLHSASAIY